MNDNFTLTTPALLFSALSLLLLAYSNRFLALASLVRGLTSEAAKDFNPVVEGQIANLRQRLYLIRNMQLFGITSLFLCVLCMFLLFFEEAFAGKLVFGVALLTMLLSLGLSIREIQISVRALELHLDDVSEQEGRKIASRKG